MNLNELLKHGKTLPAQIVRISVNAKMVVPPYCTCCMKPTSGRENIRYETPHDKLNINMPVCAECNTHRSVLKRKRIIQCDLAVLCGVVLMSALMLYTALNAFLIFLISAALVAAAHFGFGHAIKVRDLPSGHSSHEKSVVAVGGNRIAFTSFEYAMRFFEANRSNISEIKATRGIDIFRLPLLSKVRLTSRYWLVSMAMFAGAALILGLGITLSGARPTAAPAVAAATARPTATVSSAAIAVESTRPTATASARPTPTPFDKAELAFPAGKTGYFVSGSRLAPLTIETTEGSDQYYYIVLADAATGEKAVVLYIEAGQTAEIDVPLGKYKIYYASGNEWYGIVYLFGPEGTYSKSISTLNFYERNNFYFGHTITLYSVSGGNLMTTDIDADDFPAQR